VRVPEQTHLLFLPPHTPELQPAEHLRVSVAADEHRIGQSALRQHQGAGGCPSWALRRPARPPRPHPLHDAPPLVAAADQETARA